MVKLWKHHGRMLTLIRQRGLGTMCDWQNYTAATWGCPHCVSECCITNIHLLGWTQIHKAKLLSATVICAGKHNPGCSSPPKIFLTLTTLALCGTFTAVCTTLLHSMFCLGLICSRSVLWPTHFSVHQYLSVFNLQFFKADSNCKTPKRYFNLTSKHNGVLFFQHGSHWGVNEKKMAFQEGMYWVHLRTVQQL